MIPAVACVAALLLLAAGLLRAPVALEAPPATVLEASEDGGVTAPMATPGPRPRDAGIVREIAERHPDFARDLAALIADELAGRPAQATWPRAEVGARAIGGQVVDDQDRPVARATVRWSTPGDMAGRRRSGVRTDDQGGFRLPQPPESGWELVAEADGHALLFMDPVRLRPGDPPPRLVLPRRGALAGRVQGTPGAPMHWGEVTLRRAGSEVRLPRRWNPTEEERFRITGLPPGDYEVLMDFPGVGRGGPVPASIRAGAEFDLGTVLLRPPGTLQVRILAPPGVEPGRTAVGVRPRAPGPGTAWESVRHLHPNESECRFLLPPDEEFDILALPEACCPTIERGARVAEAGSSFMEIRLQRGATVALRVVDGQGLAVPGCGVFAADDEEIRRMPRLYDGQGEFLRLLLGSHTNLDGRVRLTGRRPGRWEVQATRPGHPGSASLGEVEIREGENPEVTLTWPEGR